MNKRNYTTAALLGCTLSLLCSYHSSEKKEKDLQKLKASGPFDVIIVPGAPFDNPSFKLILKCRMLWAKYLYDRGVTNNIIFSGSSVYSPYVESKIMKLYADSLHIPAVNTFAETQAEHSTENIYYSVLLAKKMGFKKIAIASDPYQMILLNRYLKKNYPDLELLSIQYDKIDVRHRELPAIDASSAHVENFVSIVDRENRAKRFKGTMGKNIKTGNDTLFSKKERFAYF